MKYYLGIDPGLKGAMALLSADATTIEFFPLPVRQLGEKKYINGYVLKDTILLLKQRDLQIGLEFVHSAPEQGVASMFTMGQGLGIIQGVLEGLNLPYELITPQKWKRMMIPTTRKEKDASVETVLELFPKVSDKIIGPRGGRDHNKADALLIALWMHRINILKTCQSGCNAS